MLPPPPTPGPACCQLGASVPRGSARSPPQPRLPLLGRGANARVGVAADLRPPGERPRTARAFCFPQDLSRLFGAETGPGCPVSVAEAKLPRDGSRPEGCRHGAVTLPLRGEWRHSSGSCPERGHRAGPAACTPPS